MKAKRFLLLGLLALCTLPAILFTAEAQGTAFTYQGQLQNNGSPASGTYNLTFSLFNTNTGGTSVAGPVTTNGVVVTNGLFTVTIDFGAGAFTGQTNWLQIGVATNGVSGFTPLTPRQQLTPAPNAIYAEGAGDATVLASGAAIGAGSGNSISASGATDAFIGGGTENQILNNSEYAIVGGGQDNAVEANAGFSVIGGGQNNQTYSGWSVIGGGNGNMVGNGTLGSTIGGGYNNTNSANYATVGGGVRNSAGGQYATVPGGNGNAASGPYSFAAGDEAQAAHSGAFVWADAEGTPFASTTTNQFNVRANGGVQFVTAGAGMTVDGLEIESTNVQASGNLTLQAATNLNLTAGDSMNLKSVLPLELDSDSQTTVKATTILALEVSDATVQLIPGFISLTAPQTQISGMALLEDGAMINGDVSINGQVIMTGSNVGIGTTTPQQSLSVAGGLNIDQGSSNNGSFNNGVGTGSCLSFGSDSGEGIASQRTASSNPNQYDLCFFTSYNNRMTILNNGNVGIANTNPAYLLVVGNSSPTPAYCDGNTWHSASDRNLKSGFEPVDARAVLEKVSALPITSWHYTNDARSPHLGPMAQDFHASFGLGADDKHIADVDEGGVALAAIQGLNQKLEAETKQKDAEIEKLKAKADKVDALEKQLNDLKQTVQLLAERK